MPGRETQKSLLTWWVLQLLLQFVVMLLEDDEQVGDPEVEPHVHDELQDLQHLGLGGQHCLVCVLTLLSLLLEWGMGNGDLE